MTINCGSSAPSQRLGGVPGTGTCAFRSPHAAGHRVGDEIKRTAVLVILALAICWSRLHATAQIPDKLIYRGEVYGLSVNPLETFFDENPEKRVKGWTSTALWRGYVATFEIRDSILFVSNVEIQGPQSGIISWTLPPGLTHEEKIRYEPKNHDSILFSFNSVFRDIFDSDSAMVADWFSGLLVLPKGEMVDYVHMGYASTFECYYLLQIDHGILIKEKELDGDEYMEFKKRQFEEYRKSAEYRAKIKKLSEDGSSKESLDSFLFIYEVDYTSKYILDF